MSDEGKTAIFVRLMVIVGIAVLVGCAAAPRSVTQSDIDLLVAQIESLGPEFDTVKLLADAVAIGDRISD